MKYIPSILYIFAILFVSGCGTVPNNTTTQNVQIATSTKPVQVQKILTATTSPNVIKTTTEILPSSTPRVAQKQTVTLSDQPPDSCGLPRAHDDNSTTSSILPNGDTMFWGDTYISVSIDTSVSSTFSAIWYVGETKKNPYSAEDFATARVDSYVTSWNHFQTDPAISPTIACDGVTYIHINTETLTDGWGVLGTNLGARKVVIYENGTPLETVYFYISQ